MKIKYSVEKSTSVEQLLLKNQIIYTLKELDYEVNAVSSTVINFKSSGSGIGLSGKYVGRLSKGQLEISDQKERTLLKLNYSISFNAQIIIIAILAVIGLFIPPFLLFDLMIAFFCFLSFVTTKTGAEDLLNKILNNATRA